MLTFCKVLFEPTAKTFYKQDMSLTKIYSIFSINVIMIRAKNVSKAIKFSKLNPFSLMINYKGVYHCNDFKKSNCSFFIFPAVYVIIDPIQKDFCWSREEKRILKWDLRRFLTVRFNIVFAVFLQAFLPL